jgi:hypothetical protein
VLENRVLRTIFRPKRGEVTGGWRKLHSEELHGLHCSPDCITIMKSRRMRWTGNVGRMAKMRNAYKILAEVPEGKRPLGRPGRRWEDNIKYNLRKQSGRMCTGYVWLRIGTGGGLL